jgi:hypothetical protein
MLSGRTGESIDFHVLLFIFRNFFGKNVFFVTDKSGTGSRDGDFAKQLTAVRILRFAVGHFSLSKKAGVVNLT